MSTAPATVIPNTFFESVFRNITDHPIYVPWAGGQGMNVPPGERFTIQGDPRVPAFVPGGTGVMECIRSMILDGILEFCSSPAVVVDNNEPDDKTMALFSKDDDPCLDQVPLSKDDPETRVLPVVVPVCTYDPAQEKIFVDWLNFTGTILHDKFKVTVTPPVPAKTKTISTGTDMQYAYAVKAGPGVYKFVVTLIALDNREQEGTAVDVTVP